MIKQGNSDIIPEMIVISNNLYQIRYNIISSIKEDIENNKISSYNYDYIEIKEFSETIIDSELEKNGVEKDEDRMKIRDEILDEKEKHPPEKIIKLREECYST